MNTLHPTRPLHYNPKTKGGGDFILETLLELI